MGAIPVYQFGYAFYVYNTLLASVNDAAQYGARLTTTRGHDRVDDSRKEHGGVWRRDGGSEIPGS